MIGHGERRRRLGTPGGLIGCIAALALVAGLIAPATGAAASNDVYVTLAARVCPEYTDIAANRARNDIQESLRDLGPDTTYADGQPISPAIEAATQPKCTPLPDWTFTLGKGYQTRAVSGPWGSLSIVTDPFSTSIVTKASTPLLDDDAKPTGDSLAGATTIKLTPEQAERAASSNSLWVQGGTTTDPVLDQTYPGQYGFGALRCAIDNLNGDNVEWIGFPTGVRHVFCYAYYVKPPPTSGTIVIRKEVEGNPTATESFPFTGNVTFNGSGEFSLDVNNGAPAEQTFIRAETRLGDAPWTAREKVPDDWSLTRLSCVSAEGDSKTVTDLGAASVAINLAAGDTVTCTYVDKFVPPKTGLLIRKVTLGGVGRFGFAIKPDEQGATKHAVARTTKPRVAVAVKGGALKLAPGGYTITERLPRASNGRWRAVGARCLGHKPKRGPSIHVTVASGQGVVCTFANAFIPRGSLVIKKITENGTGTAGFVITPLRGPARQYSQRATTTEPGTPVTATGDATDRLRLGSYLIQEIQPKPPAKGHWQLTNVSCNDIQLPFAQGKAIVRLSRAHPAQTCTFTNVHRATPPPITPLPPNPVTPPTVPIVTPPAKLTVVKHADKHVVRVGDPVSYVLRVTNRGPGTATNVVVTDETVHPARVSLISVRPSQGECAAGRPPTCTVGTLAPGHSASVKVTLRVNRPGRFTNFEVVGSSTKNPAFARERVSATVKAVRRARRPHPPKFTG